MGWWVAACCRRRVVRWAGQKNVRRVERWAAVVLIFKSGLWMG